MKNIFDEMISDEAMLAAISEVGGKLYELPARLSIQPNAVNGKIRSMLKRFAMPSHVELFDAPPPQGRAQVVPTHEERLAQIARRSAELSSEEKEDKARLLVQFQGRETT